MKKRFLFFNICFLPAVLFQFSGCSLFESPSTPPKNQEVYETFIEFDSCGDEYSQIISNQKSLNVVTLLSTGVLSIEGKNETVTNVFSGIILNDAGFILTSSDVNYLAFEKSGHEYRGEVGQVYAVLSDDYEDDNHYLLQHIDSNEAIGLSVFRFYNQFYYYTDSSNQFAEKGFQTKSVFSTDPVFTGQSCIAVGNSLSELYLSKLQSHKSFRDLKLQSTCGTVSDINSEIIPQIQFNSNVFSKPLITAPVNPEMIGGAVFNEYGEIIGLISEKIIDEHDFIHHTTSIIPVSLITVYLDSINQQIDNSVNSDTSSVIEEARI